MGGLYGGGGKITRHFKRPTRGESLETKTVKGEAATHERFGSVRFGQANRESLLPCGPTKPFFPDGLTSNLLSM